MGCNKMLQYDEDYEEIDKQLDKELFETIFNEEAPDDERFVMKAIGRAINQAMADKELEDLIEMPSEEKVQEWIRLAEERLASKK